MRFKYDVQVRLPLAIAHPELSGLYAGNPKGSTTRPTAEKLSSVRASVGDR
ncbi:MAG: hypothetical protein DSM107014_09795 [Gomphosphaeria aponina SAG 52.96 = DSM 107014]|uniref:Uncharacterized protein n=1 Tax=Gomphosphaeria aponina SAG 52.96 = DSM 107014 TaxID=1521640 RepID=A0A941GWQ5_9CHRO|nr:hypothetical protein [Gomphosphaeria aponina SAG 52.96 = DSM 107014]